MSFKTAVKHEAKLRLAIAGPSGSGKTYTSLAIATHLAQGKSIALVDTEHGSASKYADIFAFDVMEAEPPFHPDRFVKAIAEAAAAGYGVIILDSLTHAWSGTGGLLDEVDRIAKQMRNPNSFAAWKDATPIQNRLIEAIIQAPIHVIATMRSKQEYVLSTDDRGKQTPKKVGMAPQQREGFEYEFDVFCEMEQDNTLLVTKTRCPALTGGVYKRPGADVARILTTWLTGTVAPVKSTAAVIVSAPAEPPPAPAPAAPEPPPDPAWGAMTSASAERPAVAPKATETPGPKVSNPDPPAATSRPTGKIVPAAIDGAMFQPFNAWAADFAAANPHWQNKSGKANFNALCVSIARSGYARVTAEAWEAIKIVMASRATKYSASAVEESDLKERPEAQNA